jgi:hypothetical protein
MTKLIVAFRNSAKASNWKWSKGTSTVAAYTDCEAGNKTTYRCWFLENLIPCTIYRFIFNLTPYEYQTSRFGDLLTQVFPLTNIWTGTSYSWREQKRLSDKKRTGPRDRKILIIYMGVLFFTRQKKTEIMDTFRNTNFPSISVWNRECIN